MNRERDLAAGLWCNWAVGNRALEQTKLVHRRRAESTPNRTSDKRVVSARVPCRAKGINSHNLQPSAGRVISEQNPKNPPFGSNLAELGVLRTEPTLHPPEKHPVGGLVQVDFENGVRPALRGVRIPGFWLQFRLTARTCALRVSLPPLLHPPGRIAEQSLTHFPGPPSRARQSPHQHHSLKTPPTRG